MCEVSQTNIDNNLVLYYGMPNCVVIRKQGAPFLKIQTLLIWWHSIDSVHSYLCTWAPRTQMNWQQAFAVVLAEMVNGFLDLPGSLAVHKLPLCTLQAINELETWSLGIRLRWTSYTSNHDKKRFLPLSNCFLILRISFALPDTLYRPSTSRPVKNNRQSSQLCRSQYCWQLTWR